MAGDPKGYTPNRLLAWERLQRGWSYDEVAARLRQSMRASGDVDTGITGGTVRRWEVGQRHPEPRFRKHLVLVFGKTANELGLLTPAELALCPTEEILSELVKRLQSVLQAEVGDVGRQTFLRTLVSAGLGSAALMLGASTDKLDMLIGALSRSPSTVDPRSVEAYEQIVSNQRTLYWSAPARTLFESALTNTDVGTQLLRTASEGSSGRRLACALAESALLAARLAFFDLSQPAVAQRLLGTALAASQFADDHPLATAVLGHMSFIPGFSGDRMSAMALLDAARSHTRYQAGPQLRSWLCCVMAEVEARTGGVKDSLRHVRQAGESLNTSGVDPDWLDFYDTSRLAGFTGYSLLIAGRYADAIVALEDSLSHLAENASKQRAVLLADLAAAHLPSEPDHAAALATEAMDGLGQDWYGPAYTRLVGVQADLAGTPHGPELADRLRGLTALN